MSNDKLFAISNS